MEAFDIAILPGTTQINVNCLDVVFNGDFQVPEEQHSPLSRDKTCEQCGLRAGWGTSDTLFSRRLTQLRLKGDYKTDEYKRRKIPGYSAGHIGLGRAGKVGS